MADKALPASSNPQTVDEAVTLSEAAVTALGLDTDQATRIEKGEVESVIRVGKKTFVVGNEQLTEA